MGRSSIISLYVTAILAFTFGATAAQGQELVLEYTHVHHMLAEQDRTPLLRVYSDGTVRVHYPVYMTRAGDYSMRLGAEELRELFADLETGGLLGADLESARHQRQAEMASMASNGVLYHVSDVTETVIRLRTSAVPGFAPQGAGSDRTLRWANVYTDARDFPALEPVQAIARGEERLQALIDRAVEESR